MGGSNSRLPQPILQKSTEVGENVRVKYAASSMQGWRRYMEDARAVVPDLDDHTSFFAVYDGHGGAEVALLCAKQFHIELRNHPNYQNNFPIALRSVFFRMDELLLQSDEWKELIKPRGDWMQFLKTGVCANHWPFTQETPYVAPQGMGSTACVVIIRGNRIILGNVGDSRCVLSMNGQAIQLSTDHKPNKKNERERIHRAGGRVTRDKTPIRTRGQFQGYRLGIHRINGQLAVSRVIGDFQFKQNKDLPPQQQQATCNPELIYVDITNEMEFLVIASDGIWDCLTTKGVVNFVRKYLRSGITDLHFICERLVDRALPSGDNGTAILVQFKNANRPPPLTESDNDGSVGRQGAGSSNRPVRPLETVEEDEDEDEEEDDEDDANRAAVVKEEGGQQSNEAGDTEKQPLLSGGDSSGDEIREV